MKKILLLILMTLPGLASALSLQATTPQALASISSFSNPLWVGLGNSANISPVFKFGRSTNVDATSTDIWDGANATLDQDIWLAPTAARIHAIVSSSTDDDGSPVGVGARTLRIWGLVDWDTSESSEDIIMNGITPVNTVNSYVIIHRMEVLTSGTTKINVGIIKATAAVDSTITAQILVDQGQTSMAIYGASSNDTFCLTGGGGSLNAGGGSTKLSDNRFLYNKDPANRPTVFSTIDTEGLNTAGTSNFTRAYIPYRCFQGPLIVKGQSFGSTTNLDVSIYFQGFLVRVN
jgi:hypothetical protein